MSLHVAGLLLAAGRGLRFRAAGGANKLLVVTDTGKPVVVDALAALRPAVDMALAAVPASDDMLKYLLTMHGARTIGVAEPERGMGHSLACVAAHVPDGWGAIVMLGDMPFVRPETIARVADALRAGAAIVAPAQGGRRGHPVGFAPEFVSALQDLSGDRGANGLLQAHADRVCLLDVDDPGIHADVDLPEALQQTRA